MHKMKLYGLVLGCCLLVSMVLLPLSLGVQTASAHTISSSQDSHFTAVAPRIGVAPPTACGAGSPHPDYLGIDSSSNGWSCFSGDGYIGFRIDGNAFIHAGNNNGWVQCYGGTLCGRGLRFYFYSYTETVLYNGLITQVAITGQN